MLMLLRKRKLLTACLLTPLLLILCTCGSEASGSSGSQFGSSGGSSGSQGGSSTGSSGSTTSTGSGGSTAPTGAASFPNSDHVFVIMLENQDFSQVFPSGQATDCSSSGMPYLCSLAEANGIATNFYSNAHGSLLAYLYNTSGADWTGSPYDCTGSGCASAGVITGDNIVRALTNAGKTWRGYFEGMPSRGYMGGNTDDYVEDHNPFRWYSDVADSTVQQENLYPFTQFAADVKAGSFQNFSYIVPDLLDDAEGTGAQSASALLSSADSWLKTNIAPLLSTTPFQSGGDGILMITFDEGKVKGKSGDSSSDDSCSPTQASGCGGHIAFVMIGPNVISGSSASETYHFQDMLHTVIHLFGMSDYMNKADGAADIALLPGT